MYDGRYKTNADGDSGIDLPEVILECRERTAAGLDYNRVNLLMAVLEKGMGLPLSNYDTYVNIAGGIRMNEPAADLGIANGHCFQL